MPASSLTTTKATSNAMPKDNPFAASSAAINTTSASQSARPVTLPHISELYAPIEQVLDSLIPNLAVRSSEPIQAEPPGAVETNPFMAGLQDVANRTTTYNDAAAYKSTLSPTLDAFASLSQSTEKSDISDLLTSSWNADPKLTLRIIWNLRSIHDGKSAREPFYRAFGWLYQNHPKTAVANLRYLVEPCVKLKKKVKKEQVAEDMEIVTMDDLREDAMVVDVPQELVIGMPHGYWKDLLNILLLATCDQLTPTSPLSALHVRMESPNAAKPTKRSASNRRHKPSQDSVKVPVPSGDVSADVRENRLRKHQNWNDNVSRKLAKDKVYRALYVTVARLFADGLARDIGILRQIADGKTEAERRISLSFDLTLVGKWAPSIGGCHDRVTNIATPIAELLYVGGHLPLRATPLEQPLSRDVAHKLRSAYTRWALSPLRRFLQVPEIAMSRQQWNKVKYTRVPSKCMQMNKAHFFKHDEERFSQYLMDVANGKKKISGATLLPHELLAEAIALDGGTHVSGRNGKEADTKVAAMQASVIEGQWRSMVTRVKESGTFESALAVCDVSGSMGQLSGRRFGRPNDQVEPIFPAVALSILLSQVATPPWANTFITFSESPELVSLKSDQGLASVAKDMITTHWGFNTDYNAIFTKLILPMAVEKKLGPEDMIKRLFIFSDMQFDNSQVTSDSKPVWETEHQIIKQKFAEAGFEMPEVVYWNLAGNVSKPVTKDEEGVALVSGFSPGMLKVFLDQGILSEEDIEAEVETKTDESGEYEEVIKPEKKRLDPVDTMLKALGKESFSGLAVHD